MIVLDTNVVSEAMKAKPNHAVRTWLDKQEVATLYLSSVTLAELLFGISALPSGWPVPNWCFLTSPRSGLPMHPITHIS